MMRPKSKNIGLPPRLQPVTRTLRSGKVWTSYYYNGRDANGKRRMIPLGKDLDAAKRKWAELECKPVPVEAGTIADDESSLSPDWREGEADEMIVLENKNGVKIRDDVKFEGHFLAANAKCECGEDLMVAPMIFNADHKKGDPVMVCTDHGVHSYRFSGLVVGKQKKG